MLVLPKLKPPPPEPRAGAVLVGVEPNNPPPALLFGCSPWGVPAGEAAGFAPRPPNSDVPEEAGAEFVSSFFCCPKLNPPPPPKAGVAAPLLPPAGVEPNREGFCCSLPDDAGLFPNEKPVLPPPALPKMLELLPLCDV